MSDIGGINLSNLVGNIDGGGLGAEISNLVQDISNALSMPGEKNTVDKAGMGAGAQVAKPEDIIRAELANIGRNVNVEA